MKQATVVISDLFLPDGMSASACADLPLPAVEIMLARAQSQEIAETSLEAWLCHSFGLPELAIAPVSLLADRMVAGNSYWMRADPVHLRLDGSSLILQTNISLDMQQAQLMCAMLNEHFNGSGMQFFAPTPSRWYLSVEHPPQLQTSPISQVDGRDAGRFFPQGSDALKWHGVMNEIQMLLHGHALNQQRLAQGSLPVNGIWLWGGGMLQELAQPFAQIRSDSDLAQAFAAASGTASSDQLKNTNNGENQLYVFEGASRALRRGNIQAWRDALLEFEQTYMHQVLNALKMGKLDCVSLISIQEGHSECYHLSRAMLWKFWRRPQPLLKCRPGNSSRL